jgi:hypothetical protein
VPVQFSGTTIPDDEDLFRFIRLRDYERRADGTPKIRSSLFPQSTPVSVNLGSIWDEARNLQAAPGGCGLCCLTAGQLRGVRNPEKERIEIIPSPVDLDPFLGIPNPSHAELNRRLSDSESRKAAEIAARRICREPRIDE